MDTKNKYKGGYDLMMEHISVTPEMESRIIGNLRKEAAKRKRGAPAAYARWLVGFAACAAAVVLCLAAVPMLRAQMQTPGDLVGAPLPPQSYHTLEEALAVLPFDAKVPGALPEGYKLTACLVYDGELLELQYTYEDQQLRYRTALGSNDISGDYNQYAVTDSIAAGNGAVVSLKGDQSGYQSAAWTDGEIAYCLLSTAPLSQSEMLTVVNSIGGAQ